MKHLHKKVKFSIHRHPDVFFNLVWWGFSGVLVGQRQAANPLSEYIMQKAILTRKLTVEKLILSTLFHPLTIFFRLSFVKLSNLSNVFKEHVQGWSLLSSCCLQGGDLWQGFPLIRFRNEGSSWKFSELFFRLKLKLPIIRVSCFDFHSNLVVWSLLTLQILRSLKAWL